MLNLKNIYISNIQTVVSTDTRFISPEKTAWRGHHSVYINKILHFSYSDTVSDNVLS